MVGERVAGSVQKTQCDPYEFTPKDSDEVITHDYRCVYVPEGATVEEAVYEGEPEVVEAAKKKTKPVILQRA